MTSPVQIKRWMSESLPPQLRHWLWERKVAFGNRRIRELGENLSTRLHEAAQQDVSLLERMSTKAEWGSSGINALRPSIVRSQAV